MTAFYNRDTEKKRRQQLRSSMPNAEVLLWARLKGRQLLGCKFRRQSSVGSYVLDHYSPEIKLGIELDGDSHYQEGAHEYDEKRTAFLESFGIKIVRFVNTEIYENLDGVLEAIGREVLARRAAQASAVAGPEARRLSTTPTRTRRPACGLAATVPVAPPGACGLAPTPPLAPPYQGGERGRGRGSASGRLTRGAPARPAMTAQLPPLDKGGPGGVSTTERSPMPAPTKARNKPESP